MIASFTSAEFKTRHSTKQRYLGLFYPEAHALTSNTRAYTHSQALLCHSLSHKRSKSSEFSCFPLAVERRTPCIPSCHGDPDHKLMFCALERLKSSEAKKQTFHQVLPKTVSFLLHPACFSLSHFLHPFYPSEGSVGAQQALQLSS